MAQENVYGIKLNNKDRIQTPWFSLYKIQISFIYICKGEKNTEMKNTKNTNRGIGLWWFFLKCPYLYFIVFYKFFNNVLS